MNKLFLFLTMISIAALGCNGGSETGGQGGTGGTGGGEPKCTTPQEMIRCDKVLNIAHRGGRRIRPEHTLLAYDKALEDGADILELERSSLAGALVAVEKRQRDPEPKGQGVRSIFLVTLEAHLGIDIGHPGRLLEGELGFPALQLVIPAGQLGAPCQP